MSHVHSKRNFDFMETTFLHTIVFLKNTIFSIKTGAYLNQQIFSELNVHNFNEEKTLRNI